MTDTAHDADPANGLSSAWRHRAQTMAASTIAVMAMLAGALWFVGVSVLHDEVLDRGMYIRALDETGAYQRLYTDVLTDGTVRDLSGRLFDGLSAAGFDRQDAEAVANAALRLALPPALLREAADVLVSDVVSYLRGDPVLFEARVPVVHALESIDAPAARFVRETVSAISAMLMDHLEEVESWVRDVADGVEAGRIPSTVPLLGGRVVARDLVTILDGLTARLVPADVRAEVLMGIDSRERRDALIATTVEALQSSLHLLSVELAAGGDLDVDVIDALVLATGGDRTELSARADAIRTLVARVPSPSRYGGLALVLGGGAALARLHRRRTSRAVAAIGLGLMSAGAAVWCAWQLMLRVGPFAFIGGASKNARTLPPAAGRLITDIEHALLSDLSSSCTRVSVTFVLLGAVALGAGTAPRLRAMGPLARRRCVGILIDSSLALATIAVLVPPDSVYAERLCNGHAELCDRRYDRIVQAATHNSMSSPDVVRVWPEHDGNIREQLRSGIRTLMIDASYWSGIDSALVRSLRVHLTSDAEIALLKTIDTHLAPRPGIYLCHSRCAYGAISMTSALVDIKAFLDDNPDEVVTLMIQDAIDPADAEAAFVESGIDDLLYAGTPGGEWPTLGELIDRNQRLIVFSEQHAAPPAWFMSAFGHIQDTPYGARAPEQLTCAPNRGPREASLFLLNNWVEGRAPDRAEAGIVNGKDFITERARRCARERGIMPNFIAVSFYGIGDVLGAVDELNGFAPP
jgi:hypothetical protein